MKDASLLNMYFAHVLRCHSCTDYEKALRHPLRSCPKGSTLYEQYVAAVMAYAWNIYLK